MTDEKGLGSIHPESTWMSPAELPVVEPLEEPEVVLPKILDLAVPDFPVIDVDDATGGFITSNDDRDLVTDEGEQFIDGSMYYSTPPNKVVGGPFHTLQFLGGFSSIELSIYSR